MSRSKGRILIVNGNRFDRMLLKRTLENEGLQIVIAPDGFQALAILKRNPESACDVVLMGSKMPNMDGYQTLSAIRSDPALQHLSIVMISTVEELDATHRCLERGATDYLLKPIVPMLLKARIDAALAGKWLRDREEELLAQVDVLTNALKAGTFEGTDIEAIAARSDALGRLARTVQWQAGKIPKRDDSM